MRGKVEKDKRLRKRYLSYEYQWFQIRPLIRSVFFTGSFLRSVVKFPPRDSRLSRIRARCVLTGRSGSVYRQFRLSRATVRRYVSEGRLYGIGRASW